MPEVSVDGVQIHYEEHGSGQPVLLFNELAADKCGWDAQVRHFARSHRLIAFNYRGYPPSSVPADIAAYAHETLVGDALALLDALGIGEAYLVGHGTGGNIALALALAAPERVRGLVLAGSGAGTGDPDWQAKSLAFSAAIRRGGVAALAESVAAAPQRRPFADKDPKGWQDLLRGIADFDAEGVANLVANGIAMRPTFADQAGEIAELEKPVLVTVGDRDHPAFEPSLLVARTAPYAGLAVLPFCGHSIVMEEADAFNRLLGDFFSRVEQGRWAGWSAS
ncbi:alpha/beta fold hydrolase [Pseudochelatococcus sp. B33]